jgi:hypothetical protein
MVQKVSNARLSAPQTADLHELLWQFRAGTASSDQLTRLERMVCEDPRVRSFYVRYMHMCADLCWTAPPVEQPAARDNGQADPRQRPEAERTDGRGARRNRAARAEDKPLSPPAPVPFTSPLIVKESTCVS